MGTIRKILEQRDDEISDVTTDALKKYEFKDKEDFYEYVKEKLSFSPDEDQKDFIDQIYKDYKPQCY